MVITGSSALIADAQSRRYVFKWAQNNCHDETTPLHSIPYETNMNKQQRKSKRRMHISSRRLRKRASAAAIDHHHKRAKEWKLQWLMAATVISMVATTTAATTLLRVWSVARDEKVHDQSEYTLIAKDEEIAYTAIDISSIHSTQQTTTLTGEMQIHCRIKWNRKKRKRRNIHPSEPHTHTSTRILNVYGHWLCLYRIYCDVIRQCPNPQQHAVVAALFGYYLNYTLHIHICTQCRHTHKRARTQKIQSQRHTKNRFTIHKIIF